MFAKRTILLSIGLSLPKPHKDLNNKKLCFCVFTTLHQKHCQRNHSCMNEYLIKAHWNRRSNDLVLNHYSLVKNKSGERKNGRYTLQTSTCPTSENKLHKHAICKWHNAGISLLMRVFNFPTCFHLGLPFFHCTSCCC